MMPGQPDTTVHRPRPDALSSAPAGVRSPSFARRGACLQITSLRTKSTTITSPQAAASLLSMART